MGILAYPPTLAHWFHSKILWGLVHKKLSGEHVSSWWIHHLAHYFQIPNPFFGNPQ